MKKILKLRETITTPHLKGIFFNLASSEVFDFINDNNKKTLNVDYYDIYSRNKMASKYFTNEEDSDFIIIDDGDLIYCDNKDYIITSLDYDDIYSQLCSIIIERFENKWMRLYKALVLEEYNAIENYRMEETRTPDLTDTRDTKTKSDITTIVDGDKYGFNSSTASPVDKSTTHLTGDDTKNATNDVLKRTGTEKLERSGNIGVTTSQQMLESEIQLRALHNMVNIIYDDIDKVLTSPIYL